MVTEISKDKWSEFLDNLSCRLEGWDTKVSILSGDIGVQPLSLGLPFGGITLARRDGQATIELTLGADRERHIAHTVDRPVKVMIEEEAMENGAILDIEDETGSKTLITFVQPLPMSVDHERTEIVNRA
jgi:hypothetical protein